MFAYAMRSGGSCQKLSLQTIELKANRDRVTRKRGAPALSRSARLTGERGMKVRLFDRTAVVVLFP